MNKWSVYLIRSGNRTYIGASTDPARRLRQHNGEIRGGARSTRGRKWVPVCVLHGFSSRSEAYRWEKLLKSRKRGLWDRIYGFRLVYLGFCPPYRKRPLYPVPDGLLLGQAADVVDKWQ